MKFEFDSLTPIALLETEKEKKYRHQAYTQFQYICKNEELLASKEIKSLYDKLLDFFVKRAAAITDSSDYSRDDAIFLAKLLTEFSDTTIPKTAQDVLEFAGEYENNKHLLVIKPIK